ncbi:hypothetical protein [Dokdonia sp. Hel_I_53]|uniref:hypothetical protein n=1 Tax=Dokdonia sp. Hel_I_53 TaxID=1566287 RepID=UPI0011997F4F|nr:hypothetical protein [Dokdonia sp. Hel_I_53]TVZ53022.1 hypothetical protein OD90_2213 [Dokdonia sp. Hel_I_53]
MNTLLLIAYLTELLCAVGATLYYKKIKEANLKFFVVYLWYVFINEMVIIYLKQAGLLNFQLVNLYSFITVNYVLWITYKKIDIDKLKSTSITLFFLSLLIFIIEFIYKGSYEVWLVSKTLGPLICVISFSLYISNQFQSNITTNPFRQLFTYFLLGFALFFVASPVILVARTFYVSEDSTSLGLSYLMAIVVILMYSIFSLGFIISTKEASSSEFENK